MVGCVKEILVGDGEASQLGVVRFSANSWFVSIPTLRRFALLGDPSFEEVHAHVGDHRSPSGLTGRIREMKVHGERILADRKLAKNGGQVDELLGASREETLGAGSYDFGDKVIDWGQVVQGNRFFALLRIRTLANGLAWSM